MDSMSYSEFKLFILSKPVKKKGKRIYLQIQTLSKSKTLYYRKEIL